MIRSSKRLLHRGRKYNVPVGASHIGTLQVLMRRPISPTSVHRDLATIASEGADCNGKDLVVGGSQTMARRPWRRRVE